MKCVIVQEGKVLKLNRVCYGYKLRKKVHLLDNFKQRSLSRLVLRFADYHKNFRHWLWHWQNARDCYTYSLWERAHCVNSPELGFCLRRCNKKMQVYTLCKMRLQQHRYTVVQVFTCELWEMFHFIENDTLAQVNF